MAVRERAGAKDAPVPVACSSPHHPCTSRTRPAPSSIRAKEGWSGFLTSCLRQEIDSTSCTPHACHCPFSSLRRATGKGRNGHLGDTHQGGRYEGQPSRYGTGTEPRDLPGDGLGLLRVPPDSYSRSCRTDGKTCVCAHVRASWEIPVKASRSELGHCVHTFIR